MSKTLEMIFRTQTGKDVTISLAEPKDDLTMAQVRTAMQEIISKNIFATKSGDLQQISEARIRSSDTAVLS